VSDCEIICIYSIDYWTQRECLTWK